MVGVDKWGKLLSSHLSQEMFPNLVLVVDGDGLLALFSSWELGAIVDGLKILSNLELVEVVVRV